MSLILKTRKIDNIAIMDMSGRLVIGEAFLASLRSSFQIKR